MKLQQTGNGQKFLTLPKQITRALNWEKGDEIVVTFDGKGNVIIKKV